MNMTITHPVPRGTRIRVQQVIAMRDRRWTTTVEGEVLSHEMEPTGSWYARGKDDRLWLLRIRLKKANGEITTICLDRFSTITLLDSLSI